MPSCNRIQLSLRSHPRPGVQTGGGNPHWSPARFEQIGEHMSSEEPSTDTAPLAESPQVPADEKRAGGKLRFLLPLGVFGLLIVLFVFGLGNNPRLVPSPLIDKQAPKFSLPQLQGDGPAFTEKEFLGKVSLFNVWASWCVACREEHPLLMQVAQNTDIPIWSMDFAP